MVELKPPSAFLLPPTPRPYSVTPPKYTNQEIQTSVPTLQDLSQQTESFSTDVVAVQTSDLVRVSLTRLQTYITDIVSGVVSPDLTAEQALSRDLTAESRDQESCELDERFRPLWKALSDVKVRTTEQSDKVEKLTAALHKTVPESLEQQRIISGLISEQDELRRQVEEERDTISLLEKRLECQSRVLAIQEKTLTTDATTQKMLEGWRNKVLQMLLEREMEEMKEKRVGLALESQIERLEKQRLTNEDEIELLKNKNADLIANLRLKDKHIQQISNELSIAKQSELRYDQLNVFINNTCNTLTQNISSVGEDMSQLLPDEQILSEKLNLYSDQIERISDKLTVLQTLYDEKERFYSDKLESLLIQHTQPLLPAPRSSAHVQTDMKWEEQESKLNVVEERLGESEERAGKLVVEKGVISAQLADCEAARCDLKQELAALRDQLNTVTSRHKEEVEILQKRESKAAIRAKHLERQVGKKEVELTELEKGFAAQWDREVQNFTDRIRVMENENLSLKQALRKC